MAMRSPFGAKARSSSGNAASGAPDVDLDGFDSLELIGSGGFSRVYRARQTGFDRDVAVKVLSVGLDSPSKRKTFERECRAMGVLSQHPNIVTVFNAAFTSGADRRPCIVMQYYPGGTLGDRVKADGPMSIEAGLSLGVQLAGALETAHRNGVVHRDIKPTNLFVSDYGQPALGDFGISSFDDDRTITGGGGGLTVHYAPPELIEGGAATAMSDVYSLAATLFTLLMGRRPFPRAKGQSVGELARRILIEPPPRLDADGAPPALSDLLRRAMAKEPGDRPPTAAAFGRELQAIQTALGATATTMSLPGETSTGSEPVVDSAPQASAPTNERTAAPRQPQHDHDSTITIARPAPKPTPRDEDDEFDDERADSPLVSRRWRGMILAGGAVLAIGGAAFAFAGQGSESSSPSTTSLVVDSDDDQFFSAPPVPDDVEISATDDPLVFEIAWTIEPNDAEVNFQIERVGTDGGEGAFVEAETSPASITLESADEALCVTVRSIGEGGRLSNDSALACR